MRVLSAVGTTADTPPPGWLVGVMIAFSAILLVGAAAWITAALARRGSLTDRGVVLALVVLGAFMALGAVGYALGGADKRHKINGPSVWLALSGQALTFAAVVLAVVWAKRRFASRQAIKS
jgi:hypothetical protein